MRLIPGPGWYVCPTCRRKTRVWRPAGEPGSLGRFSLVSTHTQCLHEGCHKETRKRL